MSISDFLSHAAFFRSIGLLDYAVQRSICTKKSTNLLHICENDSWTSLSRRVFFNVGPILSYMLKTIDCSRWSRSSWAYACASKNQHTAPEVASSSTLEFMILSLPLLYGVDTCSIYICINYLVSRILMTRILTHNYRCTSHVNAIPISRVLLN